MRTPKVVAAGLLWVLVVCLSAVNARVFIQQWPDEQEDTTKDPQRWKISGTDDILLLVRKVDEDHPYFKSLMFRKPKVDSELLATLISRISEHCNTSNITKLVKNDLLVLRSSDDAKGLASGDRIEAWSASSGRATRARTAMAFARSSSGGRPHSGPPRPPIGPVAPSTGGHHGGGGGGGGGGRGRRERRRTAVRASAKSGGSSFDSLFA